MGFPPAASISSGVANAKFSNPWILPIYQNMSSLSFPALLILNLLAKLGSTGKPSAILFNNSAFVNGPEVYKSK